MGDISFLEWFFLGAPVEVFVAFLVFGAGFMLVGWLSSLFKKSE